MVLEEDPNVPTMRVHQLENVGHELEQLLLRAHGHRLPRLCPRDHQVHELAMDEGQDLVLAAHVVVEAWLPDADRGCDLLHRDAVITTLVEETGCLLHDLAKLR